jgi:biotin carboxylase
MLSRASAAAGAGAVPVAAGAAAVARPRVLLVAPRDSYRTAPYIAAAHKQGIDLLIASEGEHAMAGLDAPGLQIDLHDTDASLKAVLAAAQERPFSAVIGTDDASTEFAVRASMSLNLAHNPLDAVRLARRKDFARRRLSAAGVRVPAHRQIDLTRPIASQLDEVSYPCVVKPVALSASRGVIRANDRAQLMQAIGRVQRILVGLAVQEERETLLIEEFIPGAEVAVEGLLTGGRLELLAIFDKPDPLDGPYFEETYYVTPSRHPPSVQAQILYIVAEACAAYGLREGPIHAECRINERGVWILEVAARTIGGLCGRLLRFGTGYGLEELVLQHALGWRANSRSEAGGAGVLMIPIPQGGILRRVEGIMAAQCTPYIEEVVIDVREGYELVPLPEGSSYLGFVFARAPSVAQAETALRAAHASLRVVVAPVWKAMSAGA